MYTNKYIVKEMELLKKDVKILEDLRNYLLRRRKRRIKKGARKSQKVIRRENLSVIEDRPKIIKKRREVEHWEDDFVLSQKVKPCMKTMIWSGILVFANGKILLG